MIHVVLYEPEIPANTGNIIRTCMATKTTLHLIEPLGFSLDEKHLRRAGMDYIKDADIRIYRNWEEFTAQHPEERCFFLTRYGKRPPSSFDFSDPSQEYYFVLGKESTGVEKTILARNLDRCMRIPMAAKARSLNLGNSAAVVVYEALRQQNYPELSFSEELKGEDFLLQFYPADGSGQ